MRRRFLPHPLLTLALIVVWLLLINDLSLNAVVMGVILGVVIPFITAPYWPGQVRLKSLRVAVAYVLIVLWDIVVANVVVAAIILFKPNSRINSQWVTVPLDIRSPEAIALLAGTITMTPGTLSSDLSACGRALLVHCLDTDDPDEVRDTIKHRYERRLKELFE